MKNISISVLVSLSLTAIAIVGYDFLFKEKIGFVRSGSVLQQYKAMDEANKQYEKEMLQVQANYDTLKNRYENLKVREKTISGSEKTEWAYRLGVAKNEFDKYNMQAGEQMEKRKQELTKDILQKINLFIQDYGKKNNYKLILGTTNEGSILYGKDADDITDNILKELNGEVASIHNK